MSHVESVGLNVLDLDSLAAAVQKLGGVLDRGRAQYKWYGHHVGDYPVPEGFTVSEMGTATHGVITFPDLPNA